VVKNFTAWNLVAKKYEMPAVPPPTTPAPSVYDYYDTVDPVKKARNETASKKPADSSDSGGGGGGLFSFLTQVDASSPLADVRVYK